MSDEMGVAEILQILKNLFSNVGVRQTNRENRNASLNFKGFQAPFRGPLHNSGGFDPTGKGSVGRVHQGIDLRNPGGTPINPIAPGTVVSVYPDPKGGNAIVIKHPNGYSSYYAHLGTINVHPNDMVDYNTVIGTCGDSGNAKGFSHLHLQVWHNGSLIDPATVINVPPYTPFDPKTEHLWLPGAKEIAQNWNINQHLKNRQPT